jgi:ribosomal protein S18 acetylase RimI-like enzyme
MSHLTIQKSKGLDESQYGQIRHLEARCNQFDGLKMKLNLLTLRHRPEHEINDFLCYDNNHLVGYLALYTFNQREVEVSAMTDPTYRRQGIFSRLLESARQELRPRQVPDFLFIGERASPAIKPVMQAIGAQYEFSEYRMVLAEGVKPAAVSDGLELHPATAGDIQTLMEMDLLCFGVGRESAQQRYVEDFADPDRRIWLGVRHGVTVGKIHTAISEDESYLNAFCVLPQYRGRGYGKSILNQAVRQLRSESGKMISLEVETKNENALSLYKNCGFEVVTAFDYYRLAADATPGSAKFKVGGR